MIQTRHYIPSICVVSISEWIITLQYMLWEIQPGHEYSRSFYQLLRIYKSLSFLRFFTDWNENMTLHTLNICFILLWIDDNTPMYTIGDTAWTRDRISTKFLSTFMNLEKTVIFTIFQRFERNTTLHTFSICFILLRIDDNTPMYIIGYIAWTRGRISTKFYQLLWIFQIYQWFERKRDVAHLQYLLYPLVDW